MNMGGQLQNEVELTLMRDDWQTLHSFSTYLYIEVQAGPVGCKNPL